MTAFRTGLLAGLSTSVQVVFAALLALPILAWYGVLVILHDAREWRKGGVR